MTSHSELADNIQPFAIYEAHILQQGAGIQVPEHSEPQIVGNSTKAHFHNLQYTYDKFYPKSSCRDDFPLPLAYLGQKHTVQLVQLYSILQYMRYMYSGENTETPNPFHDYMCPASPVMIDVTIWRSCTTKFSDEFV